MTDSQRWTDRSLRAFAAAVGGRTAVPASGSAAALVGAMGAALAIKALGSAPDFERGGGDLRVALESLLDAVDQDARAYQAFREAPPGSPARADALQGILATPGRISAAALVALERLEAASPAVPQRLLSEAGAAAAALLACVLGATYTARANLTPELDAAQGARWRAELDALERRARALAQTVESRTLPRLATP